MSSTRRPPGMPHNPANDYRSNLSIGTSEGDHILLTAVQAKLAKAPEVERLGATINRTSAARLVFLAGIDALTEKHGLDCEALIADAQGIYDAWYGEGDNGDSADAWFAARG